MKQITLFLGLLLVYVKVNAQEYNIKKESVFQVGEVFEYRLKYGFITAAEAVVKVLPSDLRFDNKPVFNLSVNVKTSGSFDVFYKIRDQYDSYIDQTTLLPYFYQENVREGSYRRQDKARFSQDQKKVVSNRGTFTTPTRQTFDLFSSYYFARSLDLSNIKVGDKFKLNYFLGDEITNLEIEYMGKEVVKSKLGNIRCLKFSPSINPGRVFRKDSRLYLWITDDGNRVPVKAQVEIVVGSATLELKSASGLKYPLAKT
ncbi:DUF3108 domain-containing protein [Pedobacter flavus]|uniref:DUF3108 domain-containing protein n=1 Tax=Pedobacter flavus TaxID=3113906 RepID=A0ABU7H018_9SPHI|nr:DUF3108 domain-containing protein [Pedobacter sp. VNH31]MEE1884683.1 DUF3108 domain-containing protein [Pedobacter sp. VNH31]